MGGDWGVGEVAVRDGGSYLGAPRFDTRVEPGDVLLLYGRRPRLDDLDDRPEDEEGDLAHRAAVAAEARKEAAERLSDAAVT